MPEPITEPYREAGGGFVVGPTDGIVGSIAERADIVGWRRFKLGVAETDGAYTLFEEVVRPGEVVRPHIHHLGEEVFFALEGAFTFLLGERTLSVTPGTLVYIPRGIPHGFRADGDQPGRMLTIVSPAPFATAFQQLSALTASGVRRDSAEHAAFRAAHPGLIELLDRPDWPPA